MTLENVLSDRAELLSTWANGTSAASSDEETSVRAAVQRYASDAAPEALRGNTAYFAVKVCKKQSPPSLVARCVTSYATLHPRRRAFTRVSSALSFAPS
jgi:hypothetical protein